MHSSRMRTICNNSRLLAGGRGSPPHPPWEQAPTLPSRNRHPLEQAPPRAGTPWRPAARHAGIPPPWIPAARHTGIPPARHAGIPPPGYLLQGMLGYHLQGMLGYHPPPSPHGQTHTCKNIAFGTSSRTVIKVFPTQTRYMNSHEQPTAIDFRTVRLLLNN